MKKTFFRFAIQIAAITLVTAAFAFLLTLFLSDSIFLMEVDHKSVLQTILAIWIMVSMGCFAIGIPSFLVSIDSSGIKKNRLARSIPWSSVDHIKIVGIGAIKQSNKMVFSGGGDSVEINLFIFDNQEIFLQELQTFLPWAAALELHNLPSVASKGKNATINIQR